MQSPGPASRSVQKPREVNVSHRTVRGQRSESLSAPMDMVRPSTVEQGLWRESLLFRQSAGER